jgi:PAS domain S-box-containing protein
MNNTPTHLCAAVQTSVLPCLAVRTDSGLIAAANIETKNLLCCHNIENISFSNFLSASIAELVVFTNAVEHFGKYWTRDLSIKTQDGTLLTTEVHGQISKQNDEIFLVMQILDITSFEKRTENVEARNLHNKGLMEWNRARNFFREMESENRLILDAAGEGIYGVNLEGKTTFVNNAAQDILGWTAEDLLGQDIHSMIHHHHLDGELYPSRECPIYHSFRNERVTRVEDEVFWHKDGKPIQVEYVSTPIYDQQVLAGAVVLFRDITERRKNENMLRAAMQEIDGLKTRLEQENEYLQEEIRHVRSHYDLVGISPAIMRTLAQIELVAQTESNVLISGEGGTGKSLVASAIHKASSRMHRPMIQINCSGISSAGFESELFGHVRGAFSGALHDRTGKLEIANGGTLFIDEVSAIPLDLQGKILKTLQEKSLERLGENRQHKINVRIIASTNTDLVKCIEDGTFREDLYFFLNVFPMECLPLRQRLDDIPALMQNFLKLTCERLNLPMPTVTKANIRQMQEYHWPGNVRELQNIIERGVILSQGGKLVLELKKGKQNSTDLDTSEILTEEQIEDLQTKNLIACMKKTGGKVSGENGAAQILGIRPTTLYSRIKKFGISPELWK